MARHFCIAAEENYKLMKISGVELESKETQVYFLLAREDSLSSKAEFLTKQPLKEFKS